MDIKEFLELSAGKWFSQRTIHNLSSGQLLAGKSNLTIDILPENEPSIIQLCEHQHVDSGQVWKGLKFSWEGTVENDSKQQTGQAMLVPLIDENSPQEGQFLQTRPGSQNQTFKGRYLLGEDEVLVLITETDSFSVEERLWYLMPNLRLRTTVFKQKNGLTQASFCSEIRMGVK
ncbi:phycobiliprotein lyase [Capilliphycus salinus ALCB114379]|uniref:phycobiliprotein lyase n=1 Tax=Capilliphycus salinus TaxID=2768948 RepID=UPI0039A45187